MPPAGPVLLYTRVSTEEQSREGFSIAAQEKVLRAWCVVKGYEDVLLFSDPGFSAKDLRRPALTQLLERVRQGGVHAVLVWKLDRLSRSLKDTLHILEDVLQPAGTELVSTSESIDTATPAGRLMLNVLASFAQAERENTQERVRMVSAQLARTGRHMGGVPPFGYRVVDGAYQLDEPAAAAVRNLFEMYLQGYGYGDLIAYLDKNGFRSARGGPFSKSSLHDLLINEKYTGVYTWNRTAAASKSGKRSHRVSKPEEEIVRIPGGIPAIVPQETWLAVQALMRKNRYRNAAYTAKQTYMLSGIIFCEACGSAMTVRSGSYDRDGTPQRYYACPNKCVKSARKEDVEDYTFLTLSAFLQQAKTLRDAAAAANSLSSLAEKEDRPQVVSLRSAKREAEKQLANITAFIAAHGAAAPAAQAGSAARAPLPIRTPQALIQEIEAIQGRIDALDEELAAVTREHKKVDAEKIIRAIRNALETKNRPLTEQKAAVQLAVSRVLVSDETYRILISDCSTTGVSTIY